ncbi:GPI family [Rhizoctonia solani]|uniref:Glucose-6-phosphate isomerase n=1 Tax=Rhizoctonia solani TaxID=456999 RepID=A0A8H7M6T5_9AGAM|nr:GPI family [Rhizoctonia solani]
MPGTLASNYESWKKLQQLYDQQKEQIVLKDLFAKDPQRFAKFSREYTSADDASTTFLLDYSKNLINESVLAELFSLVREADVEGARDAMFAGEHINTSEDRAVLHTALRNFSNNFVSEPGADEVPAVLAHIKEFTESVRNGQWTGYTGKKIEAIVNIGIGGSDLGPVMVTEALKPYAKRDLKAHFVSNIDGTHIAEILRLCDPETTLFIVASKTFTTQETITNAQTAKSWFLNTAKDVKHVAKHFVALSTNTKDVTAFGIAKENMFQFWDWVGGRYSLWSAIGLSIALVIGYDNFEQLLRGAAGMDQHFRTTKLEDNLPVIMAVIGIWYNDFYGAQTHALLPYDQYLYNLPTTSSKAIWRVTASSLPRMETELSQPIIWGAAGTNGQHSFYQLVHQGTKLIPTDFLAPATTHNTLADTGNSSRHHRILLSNFFAQPEALAFGKSEEQVRKELGSGASEALIKSKVLGQMGVELGKVLAKAILAQLDKPEDVTGHDSSTTGLIHYYQKYRRE